MDGNIMNEIEKLYKNAGLDKLWVEEYDDKQIWHKSYNEMIKSMMQTNDWSGPIARSIAKKECRKAFPPVTAETLFQIIEYLNKNCCISIKFYYVDNNYYVAALLKNSLKPKTSKGSKITEVLVKLINELWQDLSKEQQLHIKEILWK